MTWQRTTLITVICLCYAAVTVRGQCSTDNILRCVRGTIFEKALQNKDMLVHYSAAQFEKVCREFSDVERCWRPVLRTCPPTVRLVVDGLIDGVNYLCGEGKQAYLRNVNCFTNRNLVTKVHHCTEVLKRQQQDIQRAASSFHGSAVEIRAKGCRMVADYESCVSTAVLRQCGSEGADLMKTVMDKVLGPSRRLLNCAPRVISGFSVPPHAPYDRPLNTPRLPGHAPEKIHDFSQVDEADDFRTNWLIVTLAVSGGLVVLGVVSVIAFVYKRSKRHVAESADYSNQPYRKLPEV